MCLRERIREVGLKRGYLLGNWIRGGSCVLYMCLWKEVDFKLERYKEFLLYRIMKAFDVLKGVFSREIDIKRLFIVFVFVIYFIGNV